MRSVASHGKWSLCTAFGSRAAAELGSSRGRRVISQRGPELLDPAHRSLKSADDISELLEERINRVGQGLLDRRVANTIGFLAGIQLKALAQKVEPPESTRALIYSPIFDRMRADGLEAQPHRLCPASDERFTISTRSRHQNRKPRR